MVVKNSKTPNVFTQLLTLLAVVTLVACEQPSSSSSSEGSQSNSISSNHSSYVGGEQQIILSSSQKPTASITNDFGPMVLQQDGIDFSYEEAKAQDNYHVTLHHGGSIRNASETPLLGISSVTVQFERISEYGAIAYRFDDAWIESPHVGNTPFASGTILYPSDEVKPTFFFSIYVSVGEYAIKSIEISYSNDVNYQEKTYRGIQELDFYALNDFHGHTLPNLSEGEAGSSKISEFLRSKQLDNPNGTTLLASGDMWQGTADSNLTRGRLVNDWMNYLGFEQFTLGNHEFDWYESAISDNVEMTNFPLLAINVYHRDTNERVPYAQPSVLISRKGVKIGIIGAMGDVYGSISGSNVKNVRFLGGSELTNLLLDESNRLRQEGADFIILSVHGGYGTISDNVTSSAVDLVFEAHTHSEYVRTDANNVYHLQTNGHGRGIAHAKVNFNLDYDTYFIEAEIIPYTEYAYGNDDISFNQIYAWYEENFIRELRDEVLTENLGYTTSGEFADLVVERYYEDFKTQALEGGYEVIIAGGSVNSRNYADHYGGPITYGEVYEMFPFDNYLAVASTTGSNLKSRFLNNSSYRVFPGNISSSSIVDSQIYYIICDSWTFDYATAKVTKVMDFDAMYYTRDVLANYLRTL